MTLTWVQIVWIASIFGGWSAFLVGIIRMLFVHVFKEFQANIMKDNDALKKRLDELDSDFKKLLITLPMEYQRREDSIREYTVINAKLDRLYERR